MFGFNKDKLYLIVYYDNSIKCVGNVYYSEKSMSKAISKFNAENSKTFKNVINVIKL